MTAPTEAEIRDYMEHYSADNWRVDVELLRSDWAGEMTAPFEAFIDGEYISDSAFENFHDVYRAELDVAMVAINAAVRPLLIEALTRATVAFFEEFPWAPRAEPVAA